jgi:phenylalanyl-tRNA synthetase beta chain
MKVLTSWLKEFVPVEAGASEIAALLERLGFEVAAVVDFGGKTLHVVSAEVRAAEKHPNADRLSLCQVFDGQQTFPVVCGAPNVRAGQKVALARVGATLPNGLTIKAAKLRGVESQGMICSAAELGLEEKSDGIMVLDAETPIGQDIRDLLGLNDALIEIEVTPNRRDVLSVIGIAREVAAGLALPLKTPEPRVRELDLPQAVPVMNEAQDLCPRYIARTLREVKVGPSPTWMSQRLTRCGIRSINNVVDITNYVMLELGQPLHAFDVNKLNGRQLRVRRANAGETIMTLEDKTAVLQEGMCVIADDKRPAAIAGIMGGRDSAITTDTTEVVLESAAFQQAHVRLNSKALQIRTESSYRFERGTDWNMVALASKRAAQLIQELAGGIACKPNERAAMTPQTVSVKMRTSKLKTFLGAEIKDAAAADILRRLGCEISMGTGQLAANVPTSRQDITMEADLLEEIARLYGYDNIPSRTSPVRKTTVPDDRLWNFERRLSELLCGLSLSEACNGSFLSEAQAAPFRAPFGQGADAEPVPMANPLSIEQAVLRTSMLPGLLKNVTLNLHRLEKSIHLFETGRVFFQDNAGRHELRRTAVMLAGDMHRAHWRNKPRAMDFYDLSGLLEGLVRALHIRAFHWTAYPMPIFHPKKSCVLMNGTRVLGWMGELHPDLVQDLDVNFPVLSAELDTTALLEATPQQLTHQPASAFPPVHRDLSFVLGAATPYDRVVKALRTAAGPLLEDVTPIDVFANEKIGAGKKSMTVSLLFRHKDRTLTDVEIETVMKKIISDLERKVEAVLRQ